MRQKESIIEVGGQTYLRSPVTARLKLVDETTLPPEIAAASKATEGQLHWSDNKNPDLVHVQFVLETEGANANWDFMPRQQLVSSHSTAVFKPIDMEHIVKETSSMTLMSKDNPPVKNTICGVMTATALSWAKSGVLLTKAEISDLDLTDDINRPDDEKIAVTAWGALYSFLFPKTVANLCEAIDDGQMFVSMERWIGELDYLTWDGQAYAAMAKSDADENGIANRWKTHQMANGKPVLRRSLAYLFGGVANTTNPANKMARFLEQTTALKAAASCKEDGVLIDGLVKWHNILHERFDLAAASEKPGIIVEHARVTRAIAALTGQVESPTKTQYVSAPCK